MTQVKRARLVNNRLTEEWQLVKWLVWTLTSSGSDHTPEFRQQVEREGEERN